MSKILVCGAGGFIGTHLVNALVSMGHYVIGIDLKYPQFSRTNADEFYIKDLRHSDSLNFLQGEKIDTIYQLAADMGGAGYIFTGNNDSHIMSNSASININVCEFMLKDNIKRVFYSSSACMYPAYNQQDINNPTLAEHTAYPADPDSEYGWEKLFSERLYLAYQRNHNFDVKIARLHNVFGPLGSYNDGREKAPAALCRKIATAKQFDTIEVWGSGQQTRSFLYIDECIEGILRLMSSNFSGPVNLGSKRMISINDLASLICELVDKQVLIQNIDGPVGVQGRTSDNTLIYEKLLWKPKENLEYGLLQTYKFIEHQLSL